jgi:DNA-binding NtrC family response regulator
MKGARILLVDDDPEVRRLVSRHLGRMGYMVQEAGNGEEAVTLARQAVPDVVITNMIMPRLDGLGLLKALQSLDPYLLVIVFTGSGSFDNVIAAMREGILFDYLQKPLEDWNLLEVVVARALAVRELRARATEADQVAAIREMAVTASDKILNPLSIIRLSIDRLVREGSIAEARTVANIETAVESIATIVRQMRAVVRYVPREVVPGFREIDLDQATGDEKSG